jgi:lipopolysaccharide export LptBFGC system permease protein LptF
MGLFHRHLLHQFIRNLGIALVVLTSFRIVVGGAPSAGFPGFMVIGLNEALPLSLLVATLFTLGPMARNHEITALRTSGWSLARIAWPILAGGFAGAVVSFFLGWVGPPGASPDLARPLSCGIAVVLGIGLGVTPRASTRFAGFLTALGVLGAFYFLDALFQAFGRHGGLPPVVAGWGAITIFGLVALVLFRRADK